MSIDIDALIRSQLNISNKDKFVFIPACKIDRVIIDDHFFDGRESAERYELLLKNYGEIYSLLVSGREPYDILIACYEYYRNNNIPCPKALFFSGYWEIDFPERRKICFTDEELHKIGLSTLSENEASHKLQDIYDTLFVFFGANPITLEKNTLRIIGGRHRINAAQTISPSLKLPCFIL